MYAISWSESVKLYIFVEGPEDERFFERIIKPCFQERYSEIICWQYSGEPLERRKNFVRSIQKMQATYIYAADINESICITAKKQDIMRKIKADEAQIIVVVKEIEGWYLAGIDEENARKIGIKDIKETDDITKEKFNRIIPTAKEKSKSLKYLLNKLEL